MGPDDEKSNWGYPPSRPFVLLAFYFAISVLQLATVAARPPLPETRTGELWTLAAISAAVGVFIAIAGMRLWSPALPLAVAIGVLIAAASSVVAVGGQGQLIAGFYLAVLGLFSGYFLAARAVRILALLATLTYGAALIVNWHLDSPAYVIAVVVLVDGVSLVTSSLVQHLRHEAVHDPLTGALNRRGLQDSADLVHALDARRQSATAIVEIDLDGFKGFNDTHGHHAGDELLTSLVQDWTGALRRTDILARTGGDEFVVILPATTLPEADALIARMREANAFPWSAGVALWEPGEPLPQALRHADEAMYRVKPSAQPRSDS